VYLVEGGALCHLRRTAASTLVVSLCNFDAKIVEQVVHDDGAEKKIVLAVEGKLAGGRALPRVEVPAERFASMDWVLPAWGTGAIFTAGVGARDHLRAAIQTLSKEVPTRTTYGHTGWREIGGEWCYLHVGGAIGPNGVVPGVEVALPDALAHFVLPPPPAGEQLVAAVRASLGLFEGLTKDGIIMPVVGAVYRATLGDTDLGLFLAGATGRLKSEVAALGQQHFGAGFTRLNLPGNWTSTDNANEGWPSSPRTPCWSSTTLPQRAAATKSRATTGGPAGSSAARATARPAAACGPTARSGPTARPGG
jgi:hypothetical protein